MALRSKNFLFKRKGKDGTWREYPDSDTWYETNYDYHWNEKSLPLAAGGYYGSTTGLSTISFTLRNFVGRIIVQATLASNPEESDWFDIRFTQCCEYYMQFTDTRILNPTTGATILDPGTTGTFAETVTGNFTYLRVVIDRNYISTDPTQTQKRYAGKLEEVLINF